MSVIPGDSSGAKPDFGVRSGAPFRTAQSEQVKSSSPAGGQVAVPNGGKK